MQYIAYSEKNTEGINTRDNSISRLADKRGFLVISFWFLGKENQFIENCKDAVARNTVLNQIDMT